VAKWGILDQGSPKTVCFFIPVHAGLCFIGFLIFFQLLYYYCLFFAYSFDPCCNQFPLIPYLLDAFLYEKSHAHSVVLAA
jgi:hypothetical protein